MEDKRKRKLTEADILLSWLSLAIDWLPNFKTAGLIVSKMSLSEGRQQRENE